MRLHGTTWVLWFKHTNTQLPDCTCPGNQNQLLCLPAKLKLHVTQSIIPELTVVGGQVVSTGWPHLHSVLDTCSFCGRGTKLLPQGRSWPCLSHQPAALLRNPPLCLSLLLVLRLLSISQNTHLCTKPPGDRENQWINHIWL